MNSEIPMKDRPDYRDGSLSGFCARNGISLPTGYRYIRAGKLDARKIGRKTFISPKAESDWLDALPKFSDDNKDKLAVGMAGAPA